jgi:hypothetical protein
MENNTGMESPTFSVDKGLLDTIGGQLEQKGHPSIARAFLDQHPAELGNTHSVQTGGGCQAYFVNVSLSAHQNILVVWTSSDGGDLPEGDDWMIGLYEGEEITEDALSLVSSDD